MEELDYFIGFFGSVKEKGVDDDVTISQVKKELLKDNCIPLVISRNPEDELWKEMITAFPSSLNLIGIILFVKYYKTYTA